jgi:predicted nucleic acid-binding protein
MIFIDTAPFIYLIEKHPEYWGKVKSYLASQILEGHTLVTSVVTIAEFLVAPNRLGQNGVIQRFNIFILESPIEVIEISQDIAVVAAKLRSDNPFLKGMDAFQAAIYFEEGCEIFFTNDKKLKKLPQTNVVLVDDL